tara:strand:- start:195 stop:596 length:402 start_codon:yes stop_codon:yes gene_type:complete
MNKYILGLSIILNGILLIVLFGLVPFLLYLSTLINIFFVWFIIKNLNEMDDIREDLLYNLESIESFSDHLDQLHEMEAFYGDQTLQDLIGHSRRVINDIVDLQEKYYDVETGIETYDNDNEETEEEETTEAQE